jgi:hypothetical protein
MKALLFLLSFSFSIFCMQSDSAQNKHEETWTSSKMSSLIQAYMSGIFKAESINNEIIISFTDHIDTKKHYICYLKEVFGKMLKDCIAFDAAHCDNGCPKNRIIKQFLQNSDSQVTEEDIEQLQLDRLNEFNTGYDLETDKEQAQRNSSSNEMYNQICDTLRKIHDNREYFKLSFMSANINQINDAKNRKLHLMHCMSITDCVETMKTYAIRMKQQRESLIAFQQMLQQGGLSVRVATYDPSTGTLTPQNADNNDNASDTDDNPDQIKEKERYCSLL